MNLWELSIFVVFAITTSLTAAGDGFGKRSLPTLTLPYGTWQAAEYNAPADVRDVFSSGDRIANILVDICVQNIRLVAPPTGNLRWEKLAPPPVQTGIQDGSYGFVCTQQSFICIEPKWIAARGQQPFSASSVVFIRWKSIRR